MFSKSVEYAFRALIHLARESSAAHKISLPELASAIDAPAAFTAKIMQQLTRDEVLVHSSTGPGGGFYLSKPSRQKSLYHVLGLMKEEGSITKCILGLHDCSEKYPCPLHAEYKNVRPVLIQMLRKKSIADLAREMDKPRMVIRNMMKMP